MSVLGSSVNRGSCSDSAFMLLIKEFEEAAGLGFEPRLTDPESVSIHSWLFTAVQKMAFLSQITGSRVSRCSPMFTPVTVKSLSKVPRVLQLCFVPTEANRSDTLAEYAQEASSAYLSKSATSCVAH